jgi:hypothetical protein
MDDEDIYTRIRTLVNEEHALAGDTESSEERQERRRRIETQLDQCWDLLRQREARREFGADSSGAAPRPADEVEGYLQ